MRKKQLLDFESITAIILSFIGGILDVYCLFNFNIYGTLHTGNVIKLVINLVDGNLSMFFASLFILLTFGIGIYFANIFENRHNDKGVKGLIYISILFLTAAILVPNDRAPGELSYLKFLSATLFGFEGAFLLHCFSRFCDYSYSATTMTANINRFVSNLYERIVKKDKTKGYGLLTYALIFIFFMFGVGVGYCYLKFLPVFDAGFMSLYGYNFILLLPIACMITVLMMTKRIAKKQTKSKSAENAE